MAISNPDKVVTKQDLANFYGEILPYLGGMPEVLANKFSKGDLYSADEKMIGQWIDGKPLYQQTIQFTIATVPSSGTANTNLLFPGNNLEIKNIYGYANWNTGSAYGVVPLGYYEAATNYINVCCYKNSKMITVTCAGPWFSQKEACLTVQYTKTTDSPISIGSDTDYSTEEKIVGTWIDGKPLYQKTYSVTIPTRGNRTAIITNETFDRIVNSKISANKVSGNDRWRFGSSASYRFGANDIAVYVEGNTVYIGNESSPDSYGAGDAYVTIQYTKTTD